MNKQITLEELQQLRARGIINDAEFVARKKLLARKAMRDYKAYQAKNGLVYIVLAYFLGVTGIHNFYAGYWGRGLVQLVLSITSWLFLYVPLLVVSIVVLGEIFFVNKGANKLKFSGSKWAIFALRILTIVSLIYFYENSTLINLME